MWRHHHGQGSWGDRPVIDIIDLHGDFREFIEFQKAFDESLNHLLETWKSMGKGVVCHSDLSEKIWKFAAENKLTLIVIQGSGVKTCHPPYPYSDEDIEFLNRCPGAINSFLSAMSFEREQHPFMFACGHLNELMRDENGNLARNVPQHDDGTSGEAIRR